MTIIDTAMDEVLTQYRESPNLLSLIKGDLNDIYDVYSIASELPEKFNIVDSVGDQLTIIGKRLGFPREHCICVPVPVVGIACEGGNKNQNIVGLCEGGTFLSCNSSGEGDISIDDDEIYRSHLMARLFQARQLWGIDSLSSAVKYLWGETATVTNLGGCNVCVSPGRELSDIEALLIQVSFRALPIPPGINTYISRSTSKIVGLGDGWGGLCDDSGFLCPVEIDAFGCGFTWTN